MQCYICNSENLITILDKPQSTIWTGNSDIKDKFECKLVQCSKCGHIQQILTSELESLLNKLYKSSDAQMSTPIGEGSYGRRRGYDVLKKININPNSTSAMEIGCHDGYLLKYLKSIGFSRLVGIDPSLEEEYESGGVEFISGLATSSLELNEKFDLIYAICAFEHIKDINDTMKFIYNHLNDKGELFFEVPCHLKSLRNGDPEIFAHEHIHYFTNDSIYALMNNNGFTISKLDEDGYSFFVYAKKCKRLFIDYEDKLAISLTKLQDSVKDRNIAFHGVTTSLNNILNWIDISEFRLLDNDKLKIGKKYFGKVVEKPTKNNIDDVDVIVIVPTAFRNELEYQYRYLLEYKGTILGVHDD